MTEKKILVFGNPLFDADSIALKVADALKKHKNNGFSFEVLESAEGLEKYGKELLLMDAVEGLDRVELLKGLDSIRLPPRFTTHDFDLAFNLKLLEKTKKISKVRIIAIPKEMQLQDAVFAVEKILERLK
jgi:Ni,Fe-hydrogenase maturation factor